MLTSLHKVFGFDPISPDLSMQDYALPSSLLESVTIPLDVFSQGGSIDSRGHTTRRTRSSPGRIVARLSRDPLRSTKD